MSNEIIEKHELLEGKITLLKRKWKGKVNPVYHAVIRTSASKGSKRISTGETSLKLAERKAVEEYYTAEAATQRGLPLNPIRFKEACRQYIVWLNHQSEIGKCSLNKLSYHTKIIKGVLIPFYQDTYLHNITPKLIEDYQAQRKLIGATHIGKKASADTLNRDNSVLKAVFRHAIREGYIKDIPQMTAIHSSNQRASFSRGEMKLLQRELDKWVNEIHPHDASHVRDYRELFRLYVLIITYSGIRPGFEMASLRWDDIQYKKEGGQEYVRLSVITSKSKKGEKKRRGVIAMPQLKKHIEHIKGIRTLYQKDDYIFIHPPTTQLNKKFIGKPIGSFKKQWEAFITKAGLLKEDKPPYRSRPLYSCRHYYFEQRMLNSDVSLNALALNGGTSIDVIQKWYAELQAEQYAGGLAGLIQKENL
jgi:hypothetical protein